ncbi:hypothetical protein I4U23_003836 [Adineta vaga]|nr:hypothetical protein I4U23_003836 [Adineta vaga]
MYDNSCASLHTLPVEILHCIFDYLDILAILLSLHKTCRRLRAVVNNYDRYIIDFNQITSSNLRHICYSIKPSRIQFLTLSHSAERCDRLTLFNSLFRVKQFTHVQTLTLIEIKETQLRNILKHVDISSLTSLTIDAKQESILDIMRVQQRHILHQY